MRSRMLFKHAAAVLDADGQIISIAYNRRLAVGERSTWAARKSLHAEAAAIAKLEFSPKLMRARTVVVVRVNPRGVFVNAKPCADCARFIADAKLDCLHT